MGQEQYEKEIKAPVEAPKTEATETTPVAETPTPEPTAENGESKEESNENTPK